MDQHLQELKREALTSGDWTAFDAALERTGKKRIVLRRLLVGVFGEILDRVRFTNWSDNNFYKLGDFINFTTAPEKLEKGQVIQFSHHGVKLRLFDVEIKELILPLEYFDTPTEEEVTAFRQRELDEYAERVSSFSKLRD